MGARIEYSTLFMEDGFIKSAKKDHIKLYNDNGALIHLPPTSFLAAIRKMATRQSLLIHEKRTGSASEANLQIQAVHDKKTGQIFDIVLRDTSADEIIPYYINDKGRLKIYLHSGVPRSIVNAVPRNGQNIDGRYWSGHLIEPIQFDKNLVAPVNEESSDKNFQTFIKKTLGLNPPKEGDMVKGPLMYPAPDFIDEAIQTYFIPVEKSKKSIPLPKKAIAPDSALSRSRFEEFDAQHILDAIAVGVIPNGRLEVQLLALFEHLGLESENWSRKYFHIQESKILNKHNVHSIMSKYKVSDTRFVKLKGASGQLRAIHSLFINEGHAKGHRVGLGLESKDFILNTEETINLAVVLPLASDVAGEVHAMVSIKQLPIPQRHTGRGATLQAPIINLPRDIDSLEAARHFVAEEFGVLPEMVITLGSSYFTHIGLTPQRIFPFAIIAPPKNPGDPDTKFLPFALLRALHRSFAKSPHLYVVLARAYKLFSDKLKLEFKDKLKQELSKSFKRTTPDWSLPAKYTPPPGIQEKKATQKKNVEHTGLDFTSEEDDNELDDYSP